MASNKLSLNAKKTKFMAFHAPQKIVQYPSLKINDVYIERVTQFNFLGLIINSNLKWDNHVEHVSKKVSSVIGIMYRLKYIYPQAALRMLYNALILPHFNYCLLVWGSRIILNHPLHVLQKKAIRLAYNKPYIAHTEPICKENQIIKLSDMFGFAVWKFYYRLMNNQLPAYFDCMKPKLPMVCEFHLIRRPLFHLPKIKHSYAEQIIEYQLTKLLNEENGCVLITSKVHTHSFNGFKTFIKKHIFDSYSLDCYILHCEACKLIT